jgi:hypothetical protein
LSKFTFDLGKIENPGTHVDLAVFKIVHGGSYGEFSERGFPHNFAQNGRQDLKMGCIDASRQSVLKIGV